MDHVSHLVLTYGYVLIFALVFLDQAAVSIPSPPFVTAMGVLSASGRSTSGPLCLSFFGQHSLRIVFGSELDCPRATMSLDH
jgi:membrane protein DedA with SNARE-associated domain